MTEKTCTRCKETKPLSEFTQDGGRYKPRCKACIAEAWRLWHGDRRKNEKERRQNVEFNQLMRSWHVPGLHR